jgi:hypothetical protein
MTARDPIVLLDPTGELNPPLRVPIARLRSVEGRTIALLDISKARGDVFLNRLEERFRERGAEVRRYAKPTFTKPAPIDVRRQIAEECAAVVEALAD